MTISKREFLIGAGATAAALGLRTTSARAAARREWDLIVVGGGNSGLPAAIFAAQRGASVLIIEAAGALGGTLFLSSGQMSAAGTRLQRERGIDDTPQLHYDDIMRISKGHANPELVRLAVNAAAPAFDWLLANGFKVRDGHPITGTTHEPYSRARYAWGQNGGRSILEVLNAQLAPHIESGRVMALVGHSAVDLTRDSRGAILGVVTRGPDGRKTSHRGRKVALTAGGYTANPVMYEKYEGIRTFTRATYPFSQGQGIELGLSVGGFVRGGEYHTPLFGAVLEYEEYPSAIRAMVRHFPPERPPYEILVARDGKRFLREDIPSHDAHEHAIRKLQEESCWVIYDEAIRKAAPSLVRGGFSGPWTDADTAVAYEKGLPSFTRADDLESLARKAGIDPAGLLATVKDYNDGRAAGRDALGRQHMPMPIGSGPFYALKLHSWNLLSFAGLGTNAKLQVTRADGTPIPNLYAAGELLGCAQLMGDSQCGGMSVMPALSFGRLLGHELIDFNA